MSTLASVQLRLVLGRGLSLRDIPYMNHALGPIGRRSISNASGDNGMREVHRAVHRYEAELQRNDQLWKLFKTKMAQVIKNCER